MTLWNSTSRTATRHVKKGIEMTLRKSVINDDVAMWYARESKSPKNLLNSRPATGGHQTHANLAATQLCSYWNLGVVDALDAVTK